ncbi:DNA-binding transcriptional activator of the SARP family [Amycolatopsis tolypomycina]|uniref:DNA-binding transcriptional activator of the SARP family n=1 Tax=Amycolatopsis tolypomycina TaxID=208445 RepID=A0A1H4P287_9PSEU|nr:BTAD domain-containing putative transcriptional regulator [Amycolatopsis tolypomycina]SEC01513.1 DNA-binding transcriptional activator of the SARP family [Amycolatopsis tolypomycina]
MGELIGQVETTSLTIRVLGPLEVTAAGRVIALGGPKPRLLLAALALQPNVVVSTDVLVEVLWPESAPRSAAANIRTYVHSLRRRFAEIHPDLGERISSRASGYLLTASPDELDHLAFAALAGQAQEALDAGEAESALKLLDRADALWCGEVLEGLPHDHSWGATVARLAELRLSVQEQRLRARIGLGRSGEAIAELRGLVTEHPLREELWAQLIVALRAAGRTGDAIEAYESAERVLREELDAEPGARLRELRATLVPESAVPGRPADVAPVCQLPLDLPDFTGRDALIHDVVTLLQERADSGTPAVVVLSGAPGVGKSAVAVRVAHAVRDEFPDGQLHVDLAGTSSSPRAPMSVLAELLRTLGIPDAGLPRELAERSALLRSRLAGRRMCVVLDDAGSEAQVRPLLPGAGACAVLVTSRIRLPGLDGAKPVDVDLLPEAEAARLLQGIVGAERVAAEPESAAAILRQCGHLPLAIRVAGAKLTHRPGWTLRLLADRLGDERRRLDELRVGDLAVRASVTLSYDLLPMSAATAFRGLGLLGPVQFPAWAVAAVLGRRDAEDVLDVLVDGHLVELVGSDSAGQPRYRLHDLLRVYAVELAERSDAAKTRAGLRRVLEGYLGLALEAARRMPLHFFGAYCDDELPRPAVPFDVLPDDPAEWFAAERRTTVAAVSLAAQHGFDDLAWQLASALTPYFDLRGPQDDWHSTHLVALAAARRSGSARAEAIVQRNLGQYLLYQDEYAEARVAFEESKKLFDKVDDIQGVAVALTGLSTILRIEGEDGPALDHCHEALELFAEAGDPNGEAVARLGAGAVWMARGCYASAKRWITDALELSAAIGDRHREAHAFKRLGLLFQHQGNLAAAREHVDRAIAIFTDLGDDHCVGYANQNLGELCLHSGDFAHAQLLLVNSLAVHRRNGDRRSEAEVSQLLGELHRALSQPERSRDYSERALAIWRELSTRPQEPAAVVAEQRPHIASA